MNASPRSTRDTTRRALAIATAGLVGLLALVALTASGTAAAGGWAVGTLDEVPAAEAGDTIVVGFTIRQHGVTPVVLDEHAGGGRVGIELVDAAGVRSFFPARPDGAVGHYVAEVVVPDEPGRVAWTLQMGIFGPQDLGELVVGSALPDPSAHTATAMAADTTSASSDWTTTALVRWVLLLLTATFAAIATIAAVVEAAARRRNRRIGGVVLGTPGTSPVETA